jgi:hypothetical protein
MTIKLIIIGKIILNMKIETLINGQNLKYFASIVIDQENLMANTPRVYEKNNIVFCKTDFLNILFDEVWNLDINIILISHLSDYEINQSIWNYKPKCIKKWFAQNVNFRHTDLIPLPIGLENHSGMSKGSSIDIEFINNLQINHNTPKITDKIYSNFGDTHINRKNVRNFLTSANLVHNDNFGLPFSEYMNSMSKYLFVASPRGNGLDCHRTWEALIMGSIPIVEKHFMYDNYNLPIIQIESWEDLLNGDILDTFRTKYHNGELFKDISELQVNFWASLIKKELDSFSNF